MIQTLAEHQGPMAPQASHLHFPLHLRVHAQLSPKHNTLPWPPDSVYHKSLVLHKGFNFLLPRTFFINFSRLKPVIISSSFSPEKTLAFLFASHPVFPGGPFPFFQNSCSYPVISCCGNQCRSSLLHGSAEKRDSRWTDKCPYSIHSLPRHPPLPFT